MNCPHCGSVVGATATFCRHCGGRLDAVAGGGPAPDRPSMQPRGRRRYAALVAGVLALALLVGLAYVAMRAIGLRGAYRARVVPHNSGVYLVVGSSTVPLKALSGATPALAVERVPIAIGRDLPGSAEVRPIPIAPNVFEVIWREDELRGSASWRALVERMRDTAERARLIQLSHVTTLFQRYPNGDRYDERKVATWVSGDQVGFGELFRSVLLSAPILSERPAVVALRTDERLAPGLYRFTWEGKDPDLFLWVTGRVWSAPGPCVNIWKADPDFGSALVRPCSAGKTLNEAEIKRLDMGRIIRRYLDHQLPGWGHGGWIGPDCEFGSSSPYDAT